MHCDITDETLDRLVDGELSPAERRAALTHLENAPGAWRRCAMAFLEAQTWRQSLRELTQTGIVSDRHETKDTLGRPGALRRPERGMSGRWGYWVAVAASVVAAFLLGRMDVPLRDRPNPGPHLRPSTELVQTGAPTTRTSAENAQVNRSALDTSRGQVSAAPAALPEIWTQPLEVPRDVRRSLETLGMELRHHNGLAPAQDVAGRPVWVPYRDVTIVPVSRDTF